MAILMPQHLYKLRRNLLMTKLSDIPFPPILDTSSGDIIRDFFNPALTASVRYDRGVGFFSASWLRLAAKGMAEFAANSGRARWVTSPILGEADWEALQEGNKLFRFRLSGYFC